MSTPEFLLWFFLPRLLDRDTIPANNPNMRRKCNVESGGTDDDIELMFFAIRRLHALGCEFCDGRENVRDIWLL